jgi:hypothetical protein
MDGSSTTLMDSSSGMLAFGPARYLLMDPARCAARGKSGEVNA